MSFPRFPRHRLAVAAGLGLVIIVLSWTLLERLQIRMIFPGHATQGTVAAEVEAPSGARLVPLTTATGERVMVLLGPALSPEGQPHPHADTCPTVLFFYGNGMCLNYCLDLFDLWRRLGANVLIPEYVGYGLSSGTASEAGCQAAATAAYDYLRTNGVPAERLIIAGWSLGSAVAVDLAARRPAAGLMLFSAFTSMSAMARQVVPFFPLSWLVRHRFDSLAAIGRVHCPILIAHGSVDSLVPVSMSRELKKAATSPVTFLILDGAGHDNLFDHGREELVPAMSEFLRKCVSSVATGAER